MSRERNGPEMSRRDELEALLPFYLNGTLEGEELEAVEAWLAAEPAALAALGEAEAEFSGANAANEAIRPPADALSRFSRLLDAEAAPRRAAASPSWLARVWGRLAALPAGVAWAAAAALLALVMVQAVTAPNRRGSGYEVAGAQGEAVQSPFLLVKFKPEAKMADIAAFLTANGLKLAGGPNGDGVFRVALPAGTVAADYDRLLGLIAAQPFADAVLQGRKPAG